MSDRSTGELAIRVLQGEVLQRETLACESDIVGDSPHTNICYSGIEWKESRQGYIGHFEGFRGEGAALHYKIAFRLTTMAAPVKKWVHTKRTLRKRFRKKNPMKHPSYRQLEASNDGAEAMEDGTMGSEDSGEESIVDDDIPSLLDIDSGTESDGSGGCDEFEASESSRSGDDEERASGIELERRTESDGSGGCDEFEGSEGCSSGDDEERASGIELERRFLPYAYNLRSTVSTSKTSL